MPSSDQECEEWFRENYLTGDPIAMHTLRAAWRESARRQQSPLPAEVCKYGHARANLRPEPDHPPESQEEVDALALSRHTWRA